MKMSSLVLPFCLYNNTCTLSSATSALFQMLVPGSARTTMVLEYLRIGFVVDLLWPLGLTQQRITHRAAGGQDSTATLRTTDKRDDTSC